MYGMICYDRRNACRHLWSGLASKCTPNEPLLRVHAACQATTVFGLQDGRALLLRIHVCVCVSVCVCVCVRERERERERERACVCLSACWCICAPAIKYICANVCIAVPLPPQGRQRRIKLFVACKPCTSLPMRYIPFTWCTHVAG